MSDYFYLENYLCENDDAILTIQLHVKQREAEIGIEFQDTKYSRDAHRATPQAIIDMRENYRRVLMALKHGHPVEMQEIERWQDISECQMAFWN